jgi:hypothetical protein
MSNMAGNIVSRFWGVVGYGALISVIVSFLINPVGDYIIDEWKKKSIIDGSYDFLTYKGLYLEYSVLFIILSIIVNCIICGAFYILIAKYQLNRFLLILIPLFAAVIFGVILYHHQTIWVSTVPLAAAGIAAASLQCICIFLIFLS